MTQLRLIRVFMEVARAGSYTVAARNLGMSRSNVSKYIVNLEQSLGVALLLRSTHYLALTDAGQSLLDGGARLVADYDRLESVVRAAEESPRGCIRIGAPPSFGSAHLIPAIDAFTKLNPETSISLILDDGSLDIIRDGLDLSLRIVSGLKDASHIARLLAEVPQCLVAAPAYIAARGQPDTLVDLSQHNCLVHSLKSPTDVWRFGEGAEAVNISVTGSIRSNFGEALRSAALLGAGISMHPTYMVGEDVASHRLQVILPHALPPVRLKIHAIYVNRNISVLVRRFLNFLGERLDQRADWSFNAR